VSPGDIAIDRPNGARRPAASVPRERPSLARLGDLLVAEGLATPAQIHEALRLQTRLERYVPLGHILVAQKVLTRRQLVRVLQRHRLSSRLGELLVKSGVIGTEQLGVALAEQRRTGEPLGTALVRLKYATEEQVRQALCLQLHIKFFDLDTIMIDPSVRGLVSQKFALTHRVVPLARVANTLVLAMDDPTRTSLVDDLERITGLAIEVVTSTSARIDRALARLYADEVRPSLGAGEDVEVIAEQLVVAPVVPRADASRKTDSANDVVRKLLRLAVDRGASDIHLETVDHRVRARFRIDGALQQFNLGPLDEDLGRQPGEVLSRIKILSKLDIAERRRPQDGSFRARVHSDGRVVPMDFRVSIIPGRHGENVVIRLLDPRNAPDSVEGLQLADPVTGRLRQLIRASNGMVLVTGPTGSGKSTTLFAVLKSVYRPELKIVTAEDPIEYVCDWFSQYEVNERIGNTFAQYLRSFLRHDPEVIMIGEIRDRETAELAFRAAQTGHLVLTTLHTNDAISAVTRLSDLGVDTGFCTSSLLGVLAQRLVREVCWNCKQEYAPADDLVREVFDLPPTSLRWYRGAGCAACHHSGYKGRIAIAELWTPSDDDVALMNQGAAFDDIRRSAVKSTIGMADDVVLKLRQGRTTLDELVRALPPSVLRQLRFMQL
jgi:type IV pilus assembly protein PilB